MTHAASAPPAPYDLQDDSITLNGQRHARDQITQIIFHPHASVSRQLIKGWLPGIVAFMTVSIVFGISVPILLRHIEPLMFAITILVAATTGLYVGCVGLPSQTQPRNDQGMTLQHHDGSRYETDISLTPDQVALLRDALARRWSLHAQWRSLSSYQA